MNVENVHSSGHSPVSQIATHILYILSSAVSPPALNRSAGTSSGHVALRQLLSDGSHEQPLNEVVEALSPNTLVQCHFLPRRGTSLHNTLSTCLRLRFGQLQSNFRQLLTGYIAGVVETGVPCSQDAKPVEICRDAPN